ncbi:ThiJ/PfpI family protein [Niveomyces insectorum RCEF 264]|uniref:ThiJ/PfpI family protein n=1 Tax=Niveomyces insectorum RCEF 264 TaxID=1081102 RepID=A0A167Z043_9HYPO|nr:ThiJ/PfpI family protein [Niveomyces insectorum RCEF 264]
MSSINIGVYIPSGDVQLLDLACVDLLNMMSRQAVHFLPNIPPDVVAATPAVNFLYITTQKVINDPNGAVLTSNLRIVPSHVITDPDVQPGRLDIVVVPGTDPAIGFDADACDFLRRHAAIPTVDILSVCSGIYVLGHAGMLKGIKACGPIGLQADIATKFPGVELFGDSLRWIQDGNIWSSGGVTNGNDLVAAYARSNKRFPPLVVETALVVADVGNRPQRFN